MFRKARAVRTLTVASWVLAMIAPLPVLHGQVCSGFAALDDTRYRVSVSTANYRYANAYGLSVAAGTDGPVYGVADLAWTYDDELTVSSYDMGIRLGADVPRGDGRIVVCPSASLATSIVPMGSLLVNARYQGIRNVLAGVRFGVSATVVRTDRLTIRPAAELETIRVWSRIRDSEKTDRNNELYWIGGAGISVIVGDRFTIRPGVTVPFRLLVSPDDPSRYYAMPFGRLNREIALELKVGVNFGRRQ